MNEKIIKSPERNTVETIINPKLSHKFCKEIKVGDNPEYFLAMGQSAQHSFLMLGVKINDGDLPVTRTLARIAKRRDVDPDVIANKTCKDIKALKSDGIVSRISNEMFTAPTAKEEVEIFCMAHSITFAQLQEFLTLIKMVEEKQLENNEVANGVKTLETSESNDYYDRLEKQRPKDPLLKNKTPIYQGICCFLPEKDEKGGTVFRYSKLSDYEDTDLGNNLKTKADEIAQQANKLTYSNTCRTSALNIINVALNFKTQISEYFFKTLGYKTTLVGGQPKSETLYIFPPPPKACEDYQSIPLARKMALDKIYDRLLKIPLTNHADPITRKKFDILKSIYNKMAGKSEVSIDTLFNYVGEYLEDLYKSRGVWAKLRDFLGIDSETKKMMKKIVNDLNKENTSPPNNFKI